MLARFSPAPALCVCVQCHIAKLVQQGEDISEAAEREVLEETGVRARFDAVLAMRQAHGFAFGKSDMFFVVALKLLPGPQARIAALGGRAMLCLAAAGCAVFGTVPGHTSQHACLWTIIPLCRVAAHKLAPAVVSRNPARLISLST